ncbi:anti-sigma factor antagonist [Mycolicibacterium litorale]|uniref:Anti-sigma factor antagonist n=1 Tax=Mycolicibacterium litorale TaxID=758802 RepID=A0A6S6P8K5_9MYCO|nr:STAS domain-containing protein [Mycolicibacterium litorale]BCI53961.1 anti-sigma factor antagonist [Mycolicibacterium litorale]
MNLTCFVDTAARSATVRITGELDAETTDEFVDAASRLLDGHPDLRALHFDCADLTFCDSVGLSGLLLIERRTSGAGVELHLENRPTYFDRILDITGILEFLTARSTVSAPAAPKETGQDGDETEIG